MLLGSTCEVVMFYVELKPGEVCVNIRKNFNHEKSLLIANTMDFLESEGLNGNSAFRYLLRTGVFEVCFMKLPVGCRNCCPRNDTIDIQYKLFTRNNPTTPQMIPLGDRGAIQRSNFNILDPTVIYLFGFTESSSGISTNTLRNAYLSTGSYNFISVDWSRLVASPWYVQAVRNTRYMGQRLADFVQYLETIGVRASSLHIIGFSLGAEAAGFAGKALITRGLLLGRITGLDPAYPGYGFRDNDGHLSRGDAAFVDIIHTNPGIFGFPRPIGNVDFYPNSGSFTQPGCWFYQLILNGEIGWTFGCSHNRAWRLYAESVRNPTGFPATLCADWKSWRRTCRFQIDGYMGINAAPTLLGKMYLETNQKPPYSRNGP